jgi:ElaB/YqjD/DUF883 family membrane-anchored ribosome-binding protein
MAGAPTLTSDLAVTKQIVRAKSRFSLNRCSLEENMMLGLSRSSRANGSEVERRLRLLEQRLERAGTRTRAAVPDQIGETVAVVLNGIAERFRGGASSMSDEASKFGGEAAKLGNDALRRLSKEVAERPFVTLALAIGAGLLVGFASRR